MLSRRRESDSGKECFEVKVKKGGSDMTGSRDTYETYYSLMIHPPLSPLKGVIVSNCLQDGTIHLRHSNFLTQQ
jgi:hypothetical protein